MPLSRFKRNKRHRHSVPNYLFWQNCSGLKKFLNYTSQLDSMLLLVLLGFCSAVDMLKKFDVVTVLL